MRVTVLCGVVAALVAAASTLGVAAPKLRDTEIIDGRSEYRHRTLGYTVTHDKKQGKLPELKTVRCTKSINQCISIKKEGNATKINE